MKFNEIILVTFFLDRLPKEYNAIKYSVMGVEGLNRGKALSRLQQQESMQAKEDTARPGSVEAC